MDYLVLKRIPKSNQRGYEPTREWRSADFEATNVFFKKVSCYTVVIPIIRAEWIFSSMNRRIDEKIETDTDL